MEKYRKGFENKVKPRVDHEDGELKVNPFRDAQFALSKASFAIKERGLILLIRPLSHY